MALSQAPVIAKTVEFLVFYVWASTFGKFHPNNWFNICCTSYTKYLLYIVYSTSCKWVFNTQWNMTYSVCLWHFNSSIHEANTSSWSLNVNKISNAKFRCLNSVAECFIIFSATENWNAFKNVTKTNFLRHITTSKVIFTVKAHQHRMKCQFLLQSKRTSVDLTTCGFEVRILYKNNFSRVDRLKYYLFFSSHHISRK